jgi:hypothetical protein
LGKGPQKNPLFQRYLPGLENATQANLGSRSALIEATEDAMGFASAGKLNDIQLKILTENLTGINKILNPPPLPSATVSQFPKRGSGITTLEGVDPRETILPMQRSTFKSALPEPSAEGIKQRMEKIKGMSDKLAQMEKERLAIYGKGKIPSQLPEKTYAARATMYKLLDMEAGQGGLTLREVMSPQDLKWLLEGGGGVKGDPIALFAKYFGNASARQIPTATAPGAIERFAREVIQRKDRLGRGINDPFFSPEDIPFAQGGLARILEV